MAYRSSNSNNAATTSVQVSTSGLSITAGDILIACVCAYRSTSAAPGNPTIANQSGGSSWSSVTTRTTATYYKSAYAWKTAANESGNTYYTWSSTNAAQMVGTLFVISGRIAGIPTPIDNTAYITSDTIVRGTAITLSQAADLIWWGYNYRSTVQSVTAPSGMTQVQQRSAAAAIASCGGYLDNQNAGTTGNKDGSITNAVTTKHAFMFGVNAMPTSFDPMGMNGFFGI